MIKIRSTMLGKIIMSRTIHVHIDIVSEIAKPADEMLDMFLEDGAEATAIEKSEFLMSELAKGYKFMAFGNCNHRKADGSCAGHESKKKFKF